MVEVWVGLGVRLGLAVGVPVGEAVGEAVAVAVGDAVEVGVGAPLVVQVSNHPLEPGFPASALAPAAPGLRDMLPA
jgi:hypothetical protein